MTSSSLVSRRTRRGLQAPPRAHQLRLLLLLRLGLLGCGLLGLGWSGVARAADAPEDPPADDRPMTRFDERVELEPVLVEARRDLHHLRSATGWRVVALGSPALLLAGSFAIANTSPTTELALNRGAAFTLATSGAVLMAVSTFELGRHANHSRKALNAQGLAVRSVPRLIVPVLTTGAHMASLGLIVYAFQAGTETTQTDRAFVVGSLTTSLGLHVLSIGVASVQIDQNKRARDTTGWLGVVPTLSRDHTGLAVVGRF